MSGSGACTRAHTSHRAAGAHTDGNTELQATSAVWGLEGKVARVTAVAEPMYTLTNASTWKVKILPPGNVYMRRHRGNNQRRPWSGTTRCDTSRVVAATMAAMVMVLSPHVEKRRVYASLCLGSKAAQTPTPAPATKAHVQRRKRERMRSRCRAKHMESLYPSEGNVG